MGLISIGINHTTAQVAVREKLAFSPEQIQVALQSLSAQTRSGEAVIVSTCNRTELYTHAAQKQHLVDWLHQYHGLEPNALTSCLYVHEDEAAVRHLMRVSCGLDSKILGEPQILGQLKQAFSLAKHAKTISSTLDRLFQQTFSVAKQIRTQTAIGAMSVSVAYTAVDLAKHIFGALDQTRVLLIGAGETIELVAKHLQEHQVQHITIANRTLARAEDLALRFSADAVTLAQIPDVLPDADIVLSSTASTLPILGKGLVEKTLKKRRHKPMFLVDLAVPRDIEAEVTEINEAFLYTVDDLQDLVKTHKDARETAALQAESMVHTHAHSFMDWLRAQETLDHVLTFRQQADLVKDHLLTKSLHKLAQGETPEQVLTEFAHKLTNRLIHAPTKALTKASERGDAVELERLRQILDINLKKDT
tara:strand:- start:2741 stop:4000 length:1260 start_codon:yes stop_codon:yes gene_type:complete